MSLVQVQFKTLKLLNLKIYFSYLYTGVNFFFIKFGIQGVKNLIVVTSPSYLYFSMLHFRFSSSTQSYQLVDIFSYELPTTSLLKQGKRSTLTTIIYNLHNLINYGRLLLFVLRNNNKYKVKSVVNLFPNSN